MFYQRAKALRGLLIVAVLISTAVGQVAPQQKPADRKEWVAEQIRNLDADSLRERYEAEQALLKAGPSVLPLLPPPELLPNAAVKQAVRRIRLRLEEAKARESVKPSRVTLDTTGPLSEVLSQITAQTGNAIIADQLPADVRSGSVSIQVSEETFWNVMDKLAGDVGFRLDNRSNAGAEQAALHLLPAKESDPKAAVTNVGAFRIEVDSLAFRPRFGDPNRQLLRVPIRLATEPRLQPLFLKLAGEDFSARTKDAQALEPFNPNARLELPLGEGGSETSFRMDFLVRKLFSEPAIELAGKATLVVAADQEEITFTGLPKANGTARRRGGVTVTLEEIAFQPDEDASGKQSAKFRVTVHYDTGGPAFESHRTWIFHNRVFLEDAQGRRVERNSDFHTALQTDGGVIVEYNFDKLSAKPEDYKFTYVAPTLIINVPIEFKLGNLPVPKTD